MRALFTAIYSTLFFLAVESCFVEQSNQLIYIEGKHKKANGAPPTRVPVLG